MQITDTDILMVKGHLRDQREFRYEDSGEQNRIVMQVYSAIKSSGDSINADTVLREYYGLPRRAA